MTRYVTVIGDAGSPHTWSGIPFHFLQAAIELGFVTDAVRLPMDWVAPARTRWLLGRVVRGRWPAGFQYSKSFLDRAESFIQEEALAGEIISFSQHFPRARTVCKFGGRISYYVDATFAALSSGRGLDLKLPADVTRETCRLERENYELADHVVTMARWCARSVIDDCGIAETKVATILPGANLSLPQDWSPPHFSAQRAGIDRPFVLGFVGKEWDRKGLPLLCRVRDLLAARGYKVLVRAAGRAPRTLARREGVEFVGFIDKLHSQRQFVEFLTGCDLGCLFSSREALGISTLEYLRVGVPVAGFAIEGPADTLPEDAGFRFRLCHDAIAIADRFEEYLKNESHQKEFCKNAFAYGKQVTWQRCVREFKNLWAGDHTENYSLIGGRESATR